MINSFEAAKKVIENAKKIGTQEAYNTAFHSLDEFKSKMEDEFDLCPVDFNEIVGVDKAFKDVMCA